MAAAVTWGTTGATMALVARRSPLGPLAVGFFRLAAVLLFPATLGEHDVWGAALPVWPHLAYLGIVPTALAYALYILGLRTTSATAASVCALLEPLTATSLGVVVFGESLGIQGLTGAALLLAAVTLLLLRSRPQP